MEGYFCHKLHDSADYFCLESVACSISCVTDFENQQPESIGFSQCNFIHVEIDNINLPPYHYRLERYLLFSKDYSLIGNLYEILHVFYLVISFI